MPPASLDPDILASLKEVRDPEMGLDVVDLGLVYAATRTAAGVKVALTLTSRACPMGRMMLQAAREALERRFPGETAEVELIWEPAWSPEMISEAGRAALGGERAAATPRPPSGSVPQQRLRRFLMAGAGATLALGLAGGLARLGFDLPSAQLALLHGPLLICGVFGLLITLERAAALDRPWAYAAPGLCAAGTVLLLSGLPQEAGATAWTAAALALFAASIAILRRQPTLFNALPALGALSWVAGNVLWLGGAPVPEVAGWWLAFLVLTIVGERLELSRIVLDAKRREAVLLGATFLLIAGSRSGIADVDGAMLYGISLCLLCGWLLKNDVAQRNLRRGGEARFTAICLIAGYAWLGAAGISLLALPEETPFRYDVVLHAVLGGFVFSMIFAHALIVLPAVGGFTTGYSPLMYLPLTVFHSGMLMRVLGGLAEAAELRLHSGPVMLAGLLLFGTLLFRCVATRP